MATAYVLTKEIGRTSGNIVVGFGAFMCGSGVERNTVFGTTASSYGFGNTAIGTSACASNYATAIGSTARAVYGGVAVGEQASAHACSVSVGAWAESAYDAVAVGVGSYAGHSSVAVGRGASAADGSDYGTAIGAHARTHAFGTSIGAGAKTSGAYDFSFANGCHGITISWNDFKNLLTSAGGCVYKIS